MPSVLAIASWQLALPCFSPVALTILWVSVQSLRERLGRDA
jgi:hypothetical protein